MTNNIYALLVGIDNYSSPVAPLRGCINDITVVEEYLRDRIADGEHQLHILTLKDREATRQNIIDGFRYHLCQAGSNDVAFFYYSGHGSQEETPPELWHLAPNRLDETLVCWDSRIEGGWDLADKELAKLIAEVAEKNPHITVILDCCHSGSGTRNPWQETATRRVPTDKRQRPLNSFLFSLEEATNLSVSRSPSENPTGWNLPHGRHILLAACRDNEEAKEYYGDGKHRGVFSYFLMETLRRTNGNLTYRDLFKRTNALVRSKVTAQSPQIEAIDLKDLDRAFLGGVIAERSPYFTAYYHKEYGWVIDGGAVHGVPPVFENETTELAIFPFNIAAENLSQLSEAIGEAQVTEILPQLSKVSIRGIENLTTDTTFKAVVTKLPLPPLGVCISGEQAGVELARQALQKAAPQEQPSLYIREVTDPLKAEFTLLVRNRQYLIVRPADNRSLVAPIIGYTLASAEQAIQRLEHIARWTNIAELSSPATSRIAADAVRLQIYQDGEEIEAAQIRLEYKYENNKWKQPSFKVKLTNTSNESLYCALLNLTERYAVSAAFFEAGGVWIQPGEEVFALGGKPLHASVPKELWEQGVTEYKDILKLIVSTAEFDATLLEQEKLDLPRTRSIETAGKYQRKSYLNRLMNRVQTRDLTEEIESELYDDWVTNQVTITTVRPLNVCPVPNTGVGISLGAGVILQPHPSLKANARLTTVQQASRDLGNLILPPILREDPEVTQPFQFTTSRGSDPGLSALELTSVGDTSVVTPSEPLKLLVDVSLKENEHILPIGFDGEFFLPLGRGQTTENGKTEIQLERLPDAVSEGRRSLHGSIRIFFQKVFSEKLGIDFEYPILAAVDVGEDEEIRYEKDIEKVKERVGNAERIVLYIHGVIGDTQSLIPSVQQAKFEEDGQSCPLRKLYDLVLSFDYENINTPIEENARLLKQRLSAVGLGENHGKVLHIVAHSMGGLVSRWFIEREGGNKVVQHLTMLGTPNAGSPWPSIKNWATTALAIGLNSFTPIAWPVKVLGNLILAIEAVDITLDQLQPGSEFLKSLEASPDPGIPYTIIAGNISIIPAAIASAKLERLLQKLFHTTVQLPFFGQPNDIAVTVRSIKNVGAERSPQPQFHEVACDHLTYFCVEAGLKILAIALRPHCASALKQTQNVEKSEQFSPPPTPILEDNNHQKPSRTRFSKIAIGAILLSIVAIVVGLIWWKQSNSVNPPSLPQEQLKN